jgi:Flp pilus assembly protein TadD
MLSQKCRLLLFVGLCSATLSGCASLKWTGENAQLNSGSVDGAITPSTDSTSISQSGLSSAGLGMGKSKASGKSDNASESQFAMARLCERRNETEQAEQIYNALLEKTPQDARIQHRLGVIAVRKGDFAKAEKRFEKARSLATPTVELLSDIGYCCYLEQKLPEAEASLTEALKLEPTNATAINNLALVRGRQGRYQESLELFKRTNSEAEAYANLGYVLSQNGESEQAKQMYLRALTLDNKMRAAAEAILQLEHRRKTQTAMASISSESHSVVSPSREMDRETK